jgi:GT2 family glycosyltransferase
MSCSVVIPCWNGVALTRACIESLLQQTGGPALEILVVDNGSTDTTAELDRVHPSVRVLRQPHNLGFAAGVNRGLAAARGQRILILNNDTLAAPNLLLELERALRSDPSIGAVAPVSNEVKGHGKLEIGMVGRCASVRRQLADALQSAPIVQDTSSLSGLCLLLDRRTVAEVGPFDERFGHGNFEDDDFCLRLRLLGYRLVLARRAFLHHEGHATFRALGLDLDRQLRRRRAQFDAKWRGNPAGRAAIAAYDDDLATAAEQAALAQREWPRWPDAHWHLARHHAHRGDHARAAVHFDALLRACPQHIDGLLCAGLDRIAGGATAAGRALLDQAVQQPLSLLQQRFLCEQLGRLAYRRGDAGTASEHFTAALQLGPDPHGVLHNWLGLCRLAAGDLSPAMSSFATAAAAGHIGAHGNLAICLHRRGDTAAASRQFARALELAPDDPVLRANHALCLAGA